jgi:hypothetical protein
VASARAVNDGAQGARVVFRLAASGLLSGEFRLEIANPPSKFSDLFPEALRGRELRRLPLSIGAESLGVISPLPWPAGTSLRGVVALVRRHSVSVRDEIARDA